MQSLEYADALTDFEELFEFASLTLDRDRHLVFCEQTRNLKFCLNRLDRPLTTLEWTIDNLAAITNLDLESFLVPDSLDYSIVLHEVPLV